MNWGTDDGLKIIHVDIDPVENQRIGGADVEIVGDARDVVPALVHVAGGLAPKRQSQKDEMTALNNEIHAYLGTLGAGFATAIGAKVAHPDKQVLSINGDGGFMYSVQELGTAVKSSIPVVAIVFADGTYGNVRRMQQELDDNRIIASYLTNPDFFALAESFGCAAYRVETPEEMLKTLPEAFKQTVPTVIEVPFPPTPDPWSVIIPRRNRPAV